MKLQDVNVFTWKWKHKNSTIHSTVPIHLHIQPDLPSWINIVFVWVDRNFQHQHIDMLTKNLFTNIVQSRIRCEVQLSMGTWWRRLLESIHQMLFRNRGPETQDIYFIVIIYCFSMCYCKMFNPQLSFKYLGIICLYQRLGFQVGKSVVIL